MCESLPVIDHGDYGLREARCHVAVGPGSNGDGAGAVVEFGERTVSGGDDWSAVRLGRRAHARSGIGFGIPVALTVGDDDCADRCEECVFVRTVDATDDLYSGVVGSVSVPRPAIRIEMSSGSNSRIRPIWSKPLPR